MNQSLTNRIVPRAVFFARGSTLRASASSPTRVPDPNDFLSTPFDGPQLPPTGAKARTADLLGTVTPFAEIPKTGKYLFWE
jgi:hypothetical protein